MGSCVQEVVLAQVSGVLLVRTATTSMIAATSGKKASRALPLGGLLRQGMPQCHGHQLQVQSKKSLSAPRKAAAAAHLLHQLLPMPPRFVCIGPRRGPHSLRDLS